MSIDKICSTINTFCDKVYVIAYQNDTQQKNSIKSYFKKYSINFEFFDAVDGASSSFLQNKYNEYCDLSFDDIRTHETERRYKRKIVKSVGAFGLVETYGKLFTQIKNDPSIKYFAIFEDDILLDTNFDTKLNCFLQHKTDFDILYLGASHHIWNNPEIYDLDNISYYKAPKIIDGSFAAIYNRNIVDEILQEIYKYNAPIDLILRNVTKRNNSYVLYPNITIAETTRVSRTSLATRNLRNHAKTVKWNLHNIDFSRAILKVSVILANYNSERTIQQCINSVLNQSYKNIELIVVDDKSTDSSISILESYGNDIKLIKLDKNVGAYKARNIGLSHASGFFVTILDSDDIMMYDKINTDINNYYLNENCEVFLSNIYRSNNIYTIEDTTGLQYLIDQERNPYLFTENRFPFGHNAPWKYKYRLGMQTIFIERDFFLKYGYWRDDYRYGMDIELVQRYIALKYNKFMDHQTLFKHLCLYGGKEYGIYVSSTMNYFSFPMNENNATNICSGNNRDSIHQSVNQDLLKLLR
jgi:glycosyltransferase involved in cell wall biosynthesis/GR25 family glycosyltransferase involved in LPS biosynthesis